MRDENKPLRNAESQQRYRDKIQNHLKEANEERRELTLKQDKFLSYLDQMLGERDWEEEWRLASMPVDHAAERKEQMIKVENYYKNLVCKWKQL